MKDISSPSTVLHRADILISTVHASIVTTPSPPLQLPLVHASFHQCVWSLHIISSGSAKEAAVGYVNGGDVLRLVHRNKNKACLTVGARDCDLSVKLPVPTKA